MANLLRSLTGRGKDVIVQNKDTDDVNSSSNQDVIKSQKINSKIEQKLQNWSLPKFKTNQVYKTSIFELKPDYEIQTVEKCFVVQGNMKSIVILDSDIVNQHIGLNLIFRVDQHISTVLQTIKYISEIVWLQKCLVLDIKIPSEKLIEGTPTVSIMYRLCYKVSNKGYGIKALRQSQMNETTLLEVNAQNPLMITQKVLKHDQVSFPEEWLQKPSKPTEPLMQRKIKEIVETPSGGVIFRMGTTSSINTSESSSSNYSRI